MKNILFYSFKGGTGRTTITSNFAYQLASFGYKAGVIDFDIYSSGLSLLFERLPHRLFYLQDIMINMVNRVNEILEAKENPEDCKEILDVNEVLNNLNINRVIYDYLDYCKNCYNNIAGNLYLIPSTNKILTIDYNMLDQLINGFQDCDYDEPITSGLIQLLSNFIEYMENFHRADFFIIDSTSGLSELATAPLGLVDYLVVVLRNNIQSLSGTRYFLDWISNRNPRLEKIYVIFNMIPQDVPEDEISNNFQGLVNGLPRNLPTRYHIIREIESFSNFDNFDKLYINNEDPIKRIFYDLTEDILNFIR